MATGFAMDLMRKYGVEPLQPDRVKVGLFETAFTHPLLKKRRKGPSWAIRDASYQRLEYLGDAVLSLIVATYLYERYPTANEGFLSNMRSMLVNGYMLAYISKRLGIPNHVIMTDRAHLVGLRDSAHVHEDVFEALVGAIYLDFDAKEDPAAGCSTGLIHGRGFEHAYRWVVNVFEKHVDFAELVNRHDPKDRFMRWSQMIGIEQPSFTNTVTNIRGEPLYVVQVHVGDKLVSTGTGTTKRDAELSAASAAIRSGLQKA